MIDVTGGWPCEVLADAAADVDACVAPTTAFDAVARVLEEVFFACTGPGEEVGQGAAAFAGLAAGAGAGAAAAAVFDAFVTVDEAL
jgi:uncharacterized protein (UPF0210 family)